MPADVRPVHSGEDDEVQLDESVDRALRLATSQAAGRPADTRLVLASVMRTHIQADWSRVWLEGGSLDVVESAEVVDPEGAPCQWRGYVVTGSCWTALDVATHIADDYDLGSVSPGLLTLGLVADPSFGAARALGVGDRISHHSLVTLVQDDVLDLSLEDLVLEEYLPTD